MIQSKPKLKNLKFSLLATQIVLPRVDNVTSNAEPERVYGDAKRAPKFIMIGDLELTDLFGSKDIESRGWKGDRSPGQCDAFESQ